MTVRFQRVAGRQPPPDREHLAIDGDGSFVLWRSTYAPVVGRFAGRLSDEDMAQLAQEAAAAAAGGDTAETPYPDGAVEVIEADGATATLGQHQQPAGPWVELVDHVRRLVTGLTSQPSAAVALDRQDRGARLVHRGSEILDLDLRDVRIRVVQWDAASTKLGDWSGRQAGDRVAAAPGWTYDLPFDHGLAARDDAVLHVYVTFVAYDGDTPVDVQIVDAPPVPS